MPHPRKLRWHLFQVLLIGILPVGVFAAVLLIYQWQDQERERARTQMETTRVLATALDNAIDSTVQRLSILARLWRPGSIDEQRLDEHARSALDGSPDWRDLLVFEAAGRGVFRTDMPRGEPVPDIQLRGYSKSAIEENRPAVSNLFTSTVSGEKVVGVAVPVARDGKVTHVVIASLNLEWFDQLLRAQGLPPDGIGGIFDPQFQFVARSHDGALRRGSLPQAELHARMQLAPEGLARFASLDGVGVYTSWTRSRHGWWVAFATPAAPIAGSFWRNLLALGGGWLAVVLGGLAFAALKGKKISATLATLERSAEDLARGKVAPAAAASDVAEVDQALRALERAGALLEHARQERDRSFATEREARAAAEAANRAKDEFLAMLGHELRNPLAAISHAGSIVQNPAHTPQQLEFAAGIIGRQTTHLKRLIDDLLDIGRVMAGKIRLERRPLSLKATAERVAATLQSTGSLGEHRLNVRAQEVWVHGDQTRIEQIASNLLTNAATYTPARGSIELGVREENGMAVLRVQDDGVGIDPEDLPRLFDLFFQAAPSAERSNGGLGIGLTLVKRLVELHGGSVEAHSAGLGKGSSFIVRLPAIPAARESEAADLAAAIAAHQR